MIVNVTNRNVIANLVGGIWSALLALLFVPVYLRFLGVEAFGLVGALTTLQAVFGLFDFGLGATFNREMARLSTRASDGAQERDLLRTFEVVYWILAIVAATAIAVLGGTIANRWIHAQVLSPSAITRSIAFMGVIVGCQFPFALYQAGLLGRQRQVRMNVITISLTTARTLGAVLLIWRVAASIELFFAWQAFIMLVQVGITARVLWRDLPRRAQSPRIRVGLIGALWMFSAALGVNAVLGVVLTQTDKILLSGMLPFRQFGYYALAASVAAVPWYAINPIATAFYPRFTEILQAGDERRVIDTYHRACQIMAALLLPLAATLASFSYELIRVWTGSVEVARATAVAATLLVAGTTLNGLANLPILLGVAAGFPLVITVTNLVAVIVVVPAIVLATQRFGILGAAAVWVALNCFYIFISVPLMHRRVIRNEMGRWYTDDFGKPLIISAACGATARLLLPANLTASGTIAYVLAAAVVITLSTCLVLPHIRRPARSFLAGIPFRRRLLYLFDHARYWLEGMRYDLGLWRRTGSPHVVKRRTIRNYGLAYGARTLVETGTYQGDMLAAMARSFDELYSIELSEPYHSKARTRFANQPHVHVRHGDSAVELGKIISSLRARAVFWLDAHYSGGGTARGATDTPVVQELREIFSRNAAGHVILVDDARCFNGTCDYPTMNEMRELVRSLNPLYALEVREDIIRITPPR